MSFTVAPGRKRANVLLAEIGRHRLMSIDIEARRVTSRVDVPSRTRMQMRTSSTGLLYLYEAGRTIEVFGRRVDAAAHHRARLRHDVRHVRDRAGQMNQLWVLAVGAAVGGLVQGISGFAFAMVAMAIWVWGVDPQLAAVMAVFGGWSPVRSSRPSGSDAAGTSLLWPFLLGSAIGIPLGTRLLPLLDPNRFKLVLGSMLVVCCSAMLATAKLPKITHRRQAGRCRRRLAGRRDGAAQRLQRPGAGAVGDATRLHQGRAPGGAAELQPGGAGRHLPVLRAGGPGPGRAPAADGRRGGLPGAAVDLG